MTQILTIDPVCTSSKNTPKRKGYLPRINASLKSAVITLLFCASILCKARTLVRLNVH